MSDANQQSTQLDVDDLERAPFTERGGIYGAGEALGANSQALIDDLNEALAA